MNKWERIEKLRELGLNTEESILIDSVHLSAAQKKFINSTKNFSLRTFSSNENALHPHMPTITKTYFLQNYSDFLGDGLKLILAKQVDPKDCVFAACALLKDSAFTIDIVYGAGTVRRITHEGKIDETVCTGVFAKKLKDMRLNKACRLMRDTCLDNVIFEFSYYKEPIGTQHQRLIFWEVTGADKKEEI